MGRVPLARRNLSRLCRGANAALERSDETRKGFLVCVPTTSSSAARPMACKRAEFKTNLLTVRCSSVLEHAFGSTWVSDR
jgi:hypothetical protein